jgi:hypothetical protein
MHDRPPPRKITMITRQQELEKKLQHLQIQQTISILTTTRFFKHKASLSKQKAALETKLLIQIQTFTHLMDNALAECQALTEGAPDKLIMLIENHKKNQQELQQLLNICTHLIKDVTQDEEKQVSEAKNQLAHIEKEKIACTKHYLFTIFYNESKKEFKPSSPEQINEFKHLKNVIIDQEALRLMASSDAKIIQLGSDILIQFNLLTLRFAKKGEIIKHGPASEALHQALLNESSPLSQLLKRQETELTISSWGGLHTQKKTAYERVLFTCKNNAKREYKK